MPGLKIIETVLGLVFIYLLMSLLCTAINEYIAGMLNKRGKELFRAVDDLLGDEEVRNAFYSHPLITTLSPDHTAIRERAQRIAEKLYGTRWFYRLFGWMRSSIRAQRLPSYLPARNFALALLNSTDFPGRLGVATAAAGSPPAATPDNLVQLFEALLQENPADVSELLREPSVAQILGSANVPPEVREALITLTTGPEKELQKLQDSVEVWFNNAMDRVQGSYKRYTQIALLLIGLVTAVLLNVDTIRIWRTLSTNDQLRGALVQRAIAFEAAANDTTRRVATDTTAAADTTAPAATRADSLCTPVTGDTVQAAVAKIVAGEPITCREARAVMVVAKAQLDSTELALGWSPADLQELGLVGSASSADDLDWQRPDAWRWKAIWAKLLGLILTAIAVSLGAPFWFDMLNKVINIRAAGRAPDERPKDPEAKDKRLAGTAPR
ncbi:MAG TPA: hypothetical protein VJT67_00570 [Longimicrobiaceae bacterium]|nr:hypothetical protein [Longimicrobiaceae bacterium]